VAADGSVCVAAIRLLAAVTDEFGLQGCVRGFARVWCPYLYPPLRQWHVSARSNALVLCKDGKLNASVTICSCKHGYAVDPKPAQLQDLQGTVADAVVHLESAASECALEIARLPASMVYRSLSKCLA
jgi:hypothetical protein